MPRAGWAGGMLRASKLYQSVSTSGPSATAKPMPTKTSSSSSRVWVTRCRWPRAGGASTVLGDDLGQVEAVGLQRLGPLGLRQLGPAGGQPAPRARSRTSSMRRPASLRSSGSSAAEGPVGPGQGRALARAARSRPRARASVDAAAAMAALAVAGDGRRCRDPRCRSPCRFGPAARLDRDATWPRRPPPRRWRSASKQTTALATPTLSDSARPAIGMATAPVEAGGQRGVEARRLVAEEHAPWAPTSRGRRSRRRPAPRWPACGSRRRPAPVARHGGSGAHREGHVEERAGRGPHRLGVVGVDRVGREDDRASAPAASAARSTVPALPGSRTSTQRPRSRATASAGPAGVGSGVPARSEHRRARPAPAAASPCRPPARARPAPGRRPGAPAAGGPAAHLLGRRVVAAGGRHVDRLDRRARRRGRCGGARRPRRRRRARSSAPNASAAARAAGGPAGA